MSTRHLVRQVVAAVIAMRVEHILRTSRRTIERTIGRMTAAGARIDAVVDMRDIMTIMMMAQDIIARRAGLGIVDFAVWDVLRIHLEPGVCDGMVFRAHIGGVGRNK